MDMYVPVCIEYYLLVKHIIKEEKKEELQLVGNEKCMVEKDRTTCKHQIHTDTK